MTPVERAFLERRRVATLATVDDEGYPHVVPICYALVGTGSDVRLVTAIDEKPKSTLDLRRVRNVQSEPRVAVLADRYREDWSRLAWVQVRGLAQLLDPGESDHDEAVTALESRYEQYENHGLTDRPIIDVDVEATRSWGVLES